MIFPGLVSITFRKLAPDAIATLASRAGLASIEWGGDIHVRHGDLAQAAAVRRLTQEHGLRTAAYGSYYRAGESEAAGLAFEAVLDTASTLGAPTIRIWAGTRDSADADEAYRRKVTDDLRRITPLAAARGITLSTEFHRGTLCDTAPETVALWNAVEHPDLKTYWQPRVDQPVEVGLEEIPALAPRLTHVHVFHWPRGTERAPLADGGAAWVRYLEALRSLPGDRDALLEFVRDDAPEAFLEDARTLRGWLAME